MSTGENPVPAAEKRSVNGKRLDPLLDLEEFSRTGFGWGYRGAGPAQLALAVLAHAAGDEIAR